MLRDLARPAAAQTTMPDVRAERCVHSVTEQAGCRACVDACPTGAWVIDEEMLGIDPNRCDGCDLCVAACPEAAILQRFRPAVRDTPHGNVALACCERSQVAGEGVPRMPCLHAIGISDLMRLARGQVRYLITSTGDCNSCPRGKGERLEDRLRAVNAMLSDRSETPIAHRSPGASHWKDTWHQVDTLAKGNRISRRSFFRSAVTEPTKRIEAVLDRAEGTFTAPGSLLPCRSPSDPAPIVPQIDPARCSGCDTCVRLCPHEAIRIEIEDTVPRAYAIIADQCTGCGICADLCERDAVHILRWRPVGRDRLPLANRQCPACGVTYHIPLNDRSSPETDDLCPICLRTDHHKHLYQVLD